MPDMGGDEAPAPTQQTVNNVNIPEYARPYVEDMLGRSQALTTQNPYQSYGGQRVSGFTPLQQASYTGAAGMQPSRYLTEAGRTINNAVSQATGAGYYAPGEFNAGDSPRDVSANLWGQGAATHYMNPYMRSVVDIEKREATRQADMQAQRDGASAVGAGAFGGSRHAIVDAERDRNLMQLHGDIESRGLNQAWQQAQNMFTSDQGRVQQGQLANQRAGLDWNSQRLTAQQLGEQSRQYGAGMAMQGAQTTLAAADMLGNLGQNQYNQQLGILGLQNQLGTQMQTTQQAGLDAQYQDWQNRQNWPYRQLEFQNSMIRGLPISQGTSTMYQAPPSPLSQMAGIATAGYGISRMADGGLAEIAKKPQAKRKKPPKYAKGGTIDVSAREVPNDDSAGLANLLISQIN